MKKLAFLLALISPLAGNAAILTPLNTSPIGKIAQFTLNEHQELLVINQQGELWNLQNSQKLANALSPEFKIAAAHGRIAGSDYKGHFIQIAGKDITHSNIPLSPKSGLIMLPFATIAVITQNNHTHLARIEQQGSLQITATSTIRVLPDARPLLIDLDNSHDLGQIAVLSSPDSETYQHAVLGDEIEAATLSYLERHSLEPITPPFGKNGLVFEANSLGTAKINGKNTLLTVLSGNNEGGRTVLVEKNGSNLKLLAESEPLPTNRWQSPFFFNGSIYTVQMPHLIGRLAELNLEKGHLKEKVLGTGFSNHAYGDHETNLVSSTAEFAVIPHSGYRQISVLDKSSKLTKLQTTLPSEIVYTEASQKIVYLLLKNGEIWQVSP